MMNGHHSRTCSILMILILAAASAVMAMDYVDIGDPASEAGHTMTGWGPIQPATSGGNYGGIDHCRAIWSSLDGTNSASIALWFDWGNEEVAFRHLEGLADDGFMVYLDGELKYTHTESTETEIWFVSGFVTAEAEGWHVLEFVATGDAWSGWETYGQVCIAEIWVSGGPVGNEDHTWGRVKDLFR